MSAFGKCAGGGRRSTERIEASLGAVFATVTGSTSAELVDISRGGARLRGGQLPAEGDEVMLTVSPIKAYALVTWRDAEECGMTFDPGLCTAQIEALGRRAAQARGLSADVKAALDDWSGGFVR